MLNFSDVTASPDDRATDKIEMRIKPSGEARISWAAELTGVKRTTFVRAAAAKEAERVLRGHQATTLSERDRQPLMAALDHPPPPTRAARDAVRDHRSRITSAR